MKKNLFLFLLFFQTLFLFSQTISLQKIAEGITSPVAMANAADGSNRLFICEQHGLVRIIKNNQLLEHPFLDIKEKIIRQMNLYSERGLLGIAFHPKFKSNRKFYVYYSAKSIKSESNHKSVIAEYLASSTNSDQADKNSGRIILEVEQPESNHNGGQMAFGSDGFLYIGLGDGGGANDEHGKTGNGQNLNTLLGKIIRIDVNTSSAYKIPADNPFVGKPGLDEIWAYGLRNPWKFSFDKVTKRLFCADVGQNTWEEVDIIEKGKNYGWRVMEAGHCFNPEYNCNQRGLEMPIAEYNHSEGISITGGYVYRGAKKDFYGKYIFADWREKLFMLTEQSNKSWKFETLSLPNLEGNIYINSMGEDENGEIYLLTLKGIGPAKPQGVVYKIVF